MDADSLIHVAKPDDSSDRLYPISMGRYGPQVAIPRILETYKRFELKAVILYSRVVSGNLSKCCRFNIEGWP